MLMPSLKSSAGSDVLPALTAADVLRIVSDSRTPVFVTVYESGRRRCGYWQPYDSGTGKGGCYVALPTTICEELYALGRITLGEPVVDPTRTTYRVRATRTRTRSTRTTPVRPHRAPVRTPSAPVVVATAPGRAPAVRPLVA
ncbi:hypothetical protein ACH4F6_21025 [Streptomyces sp. NPDC017936]|uniref:hypothetical protein n=1 Tax=Streptomyces sp. NPDC017936 TaxID=3365016 RepID=UPI0037B4A88D